jgi:hypothetical protein
MRIAWMEAPTACGQVAIIFQNQHLVVSSSPEAETDYGETAVAYSQVDVQFQSPHVVRLRVPLNALGSHFTATEPWIGYSLGYVCPPGLQLEDETDVVTPRV